MDFLNFELIWYKEKNTIEKIQLAESSFLHFVRSDDPSVT